VARYILFYPFCSTVVFYVLPNHYCFLLLYFSVLLLFCISHPMHPVPPINTTCPLSCSPTPLTTPPLHINFPTPHISPQIFLDGVDTRTVSLESLRGRISVVPQDTSLFDETVEYNLRYEGGEAGILVHTFQAVLCCVVLCCILMYFCLALSVHVLCVCYYVVLCVLCA
jgi:hypothetical protein